MFAEIVQQSGRLLVVSNLRSEQFEETILFRLGEKEMHGCDVVEKDGYEKVTIASNSSHFESSIVVTSGVVNVKHIEGLGYTCSIPREARADEHAIDWSTLTILLESDCDGEANVLVNEDQIYEDMGFKEANEGAAVEELPIPNIPTEVRSTY